MPSFIRNFSTLLSGNGLAFGIQLASAPILTRLFEPEDFGVYANVMAVVALLNVFGAGRYEQAIVKGAAKGHSLGLARLSLTLSVWSSALSLLPLWLMRTSIQENFSLNPLWLLWGIPPIALASLVFGILIQVANAQGDYRRMSLAKVVYALAVAAISTCAGVMSMGGEGLVASAAAGYALAGFLLIPQAIGAWKDQTSDARQLSREYKEFPQWNLPLAVVDALNQQFFFNLIFTAAFGVKAMGWYAVTWRYVRAPAKLVQQSAAGLFYREAALLLDRPKPLVALFNKTAAGAALMAVPLVLVLVFYGPELFSFILGETWEVAGSYAQVLAPLVGISLITGVVSTTPMLKGRQRSFAFLSGTGQALSLLVLWQGGIHSGLGESGVPIGLFYYVGMGCLVSVVLLVWFRVLIGQKHP
jgi:lipopolysaccharide exporter